MTETYQGTFIAKMIETATRVKQENMYETLEVAQLALADGMVGKNGEVIERNVAAWYDIAALKGILVAENSLGQCWHETLETAKGNCDGGERCTAQATEEIGGMAFCKKHADAERAAQTETLNSINRQIHAVKG